VFGVFKRHYLNYKELKKDSVEIWKNFFISSNILNDTQRCLLYFNLPFDDIIKDEVQPRLLFSQDLRNAPTKGNNYLNEMLNKFEQEKDGKNRLANIILLKVPNAQSEYSAANRPDDF